MTSRFALLSLSLFAALVAGCRSGLPPQNRVGCSAPKAAPEDLARPQEHRTPQAEGEGPAQARQVSYSSQPEVLPQGAPFDGPVELDELVGYALACNPRIQAARYHARALGARVPQAKSLPDPQLMTTVFLEEIQTAAGPQELALALSQKIPWFEKRAFRSQVAYYDAMAAYARVTATELEVIEQVKLAYFDLYWLGSAIAETRRLEPRLEEVMEVARTRYETNAPGAGLETVLQAEVELAKLKSRLVELEEAHRRAQARLAGVLHLPSSTRIEATEQVDRSQLAHQAELLVALAESWQPELEARRREIGRDQASICLAQREYWPDVSLGATWYEIGGAGLSPVANGRDAVSLGLGVNLPIYRGRLDAGVREARYKTAASSRRFASERDRVSAEIAALYAQFREHDRMLGIVQSDILPRAEQTLELATESYRTGRQSFQQLIDVYRTLLSYRTELHRHVAAREQTIASLERAVGCSVAEAGS
jgi:cobalt-zinc-cadmium efflux system outer membrane protein